MLSLFAVLVAAAPPFTGTILYVDANDKVVVTAQIGQTQALIVGNSRVFIDEKGQRFEQEKPGAAVRPAPPPPPQPKMTATKLADRTVAGRTARCLRFRVPAANAADSVDVCVFEDARDAINIDGASSEVVEAFKAIGVRGLLASVTLRSGDVVNSDFHARAVAPGPPPPTTKEKFFFVAPPLAP